MHHLQGLPEFLPGKRNFDFINSLQEQTDQKGREQTARSRPFFFH